MPKEVTSGMQDSSSSSKEGSPFDVPQISLPKGGGAIRGIGEKFTANAATGTGSLTVPIALSSGRSGFGPQLSLAYDSGSGNGPFGIGWSLGLPSITRKTDKGLPRYRDSEESDVFILTASEDLVPVLKQAGHDHWLPDEFERDGYRVRRYRPRIEGLFSRIERWTRLHDGDTHWRSISKDNILTVYGRTANSRISDPIEPSHVFSWLICESYDDKGNAIHYEYVAENNSGVDLDRPNERNRVRSANRYLKRIHYGNRKPLLLDVDLPSFRKSHVPLPELKDADWMFEAVLDYGDADYTQDEPDDERRVWVRTTAHERPGSHWPVRKDPFSKYRSGFEVRTYRLCRRVLMFHHFPEELGAKDYLVRSTEFEFHEKPLSSFISRVAQSGFSRHADGRYLKKSLPALEVAYTSSPLEDVEYRGYHVHEAAPANLPGGIDSESYKWLDLNGEGISGVLTEQGDAWFYKRNAGRGRFRPIEVVSPAPSLAALSKGKQQLLDLAGDGNLDLVQLSSDTPGFYERTLEDGWGSFRAFRSFPVLKWDDPNLHFVDVTGDGIADVLVKEDDAFTWHPSLLEHGFGAAVRVPVPQDEREGPHVVFADGTQSIYLADMSGDGLSDIVRIRNGEVCYWPNTGYGTFGRKVTMDDSPWFEDPDLFDQKRIKLADTDGSGTTDILYLGRNGIRIFLNQAGNGWSAARELPQFAAADDQTAVSVVDFLGRGTMCLLWSSSLPGDSQRPLRYVDLMNGHKPHLLTHVRNNLGAETRIEYASSTEFYLADQAAGEPWVTRLPFPVHVVKRVETYDYISRNRFVRSYTYHHGFFDSVEREFRGFGRVDELDTEAFATLSKSSAFPVGENVRAESSVPPVLTKIWFHTGVYLAGGRVSRHLANEYWREPGLSRSEQQAMLLDDTILPDDMAAEEAREACRSLKGSTLRQETYALDEKEESSRPYTVEENNFTIRLLQPRGRNRHAVFFTHARETLSFNYERKVYDMEESRRADPRVTHNVNLEVDDYGNVLKSVSAGYGRRFPEPSPLLSNADRDKQKQILSTLTTNRYTNAVRHADAYRDPLLAETQSYELIHVTPKACEFGVTNLFRFHELAAKVAQASDGHHDLPYEDLLAEGAETPAPYRRLLKNSRMLYRANGLDRILDLGMLEALGLPGENYKLAFTPGLLAEVYRRSSPDQPPENLLPAPAAVLRDQAGYMDLDGNGHWWMPSGTVFYSRNTIDTAAPELDHARHHFFLPMRFHDPFGNVSMVGYDAHDLTAVDARDPLGNTLHAVIDYRVLSPYVMSDVNGSRSQAAFDALGMVVATAVMGKEGENQGDTLEGLALDLSEPTILKHVRHPLRDPWEILQGATERLVYDLFAYERTRSRSQPEPAVVYTLARETHVTDLEPGQKTRIQHSFSYSDGYGREIQKKTQAETGPLVHGGPTISPRWVGSGWTIFNNQGKPVRQYEPFFSPTQEFEFAKIVGVSPVLFYDPVKRVVATLHPNHTFDKVIFDAWHKQSWDVNDTVLETDPAADPEVGDFFQRLPSSDFLPSWYSLRTDPTYAVAAAQLWPDPTIRAKETEAAGKAAAHAYTPAIAHLDSFGRSFLTIDDNASAGKFAMRVELDIEGNQRFVTDALGRKAVVYDYDLLQNRIHHSSMEAGERWMLNDVIGKQVRSWDSRGHNFRTEYDALRRPTGVFVQGTDSVNSDPRTTSAEVQVQKIEYGESQPESLNLRTRVFKRSDSAGVVTNMAKDPATGQDEAYDFKGNLLRSVRQFAIDYKALPDWNTTPALETETFTSSTQYDALNRPITETTPDGSIVRPTYNEANFIESVSVNLRGAAAATAFVTNIDYDAKGQRVLVEYGNNTQSQYAYDPETFRLTQLTTTRLGFPQNEQVVQDLFYTYDPAGNITHIQDDADTQNTVFFRNQRVEPSNDYTYDAIYRLIQASGREQLGLDAGGNKLPPTASSYNDVPRVGLSPLPTDGNAVGLYNEQYRYDAVGNFLQVIHKGPNPSDPGWTRTYSYSEASLLEPGKVSNRLSRTAVSGNRPLNEPYTHDLHGNMTSMPQLQAMQWNFKDELLMTQRQAVNASDAGGVQHQGERTYYVYDSNGRRARKVTESAAGIKTKERFYLDGFEVYRKYDSGGLITLERQTLHVMDDKLRVALVETRTEGSDPSPAQLMRYQFSNHLGSACVELDDMAQIISYEEYCPYGNTSYQAGRSAVEVAPKRYRYTAKERDEETGFTYHEARYFAPWLGRWSSADPSGLNDGINLYAYCHNSPLRFADHTGRDADEESLKKGAATTQKFKSTVETAVTDYAAGSGLTTADFLTIINIESSGDPKASTGSHKGLFQLSKRDNYTSKEFADARSSRFNKTADDKNFQWTDQGILDPTTNIRYGTFVVTERIRLAKESIGRKATLEAQQKTIAADKTKLLQDQADKQTRLKALTDKQKSLKKGQHMTDDEKSEMKDLRDWLGDFRGKSIDIKTKEDQNTADLKLETQLAPGNALLEQFMKDHPAAAAYLLHQQGIAGLRNILSNPSGQISAEQQGNLTDSAKSTVKTNKQFVDFWVNRFDKAKSFVKP